MNHTLKIPRRSLLFVGPQRCGKTFALTAAVAQSSQENKVVILCSTAEWRHNKDDFAAYGDLDNVLQIDLDCPNVPEKFAAAKWGIKDLSAVAVMTQTVFVDVGTVLFYVKPSESVIKFLEHLCEPTANLPHIYIESHLASQKDELALG